LASALGSERLRLYMEPDRVATDEERSTLRDWVQRASVHEPVQYLVGECWFRGLRIEVDASTMIPRPATETLVEVGHGRITRTGAKAKILDLCTGTGCIPIALLTSIDRPHRAAARLEEADAVARADFARLRAAVGVDAGDGATPAENAAEVSVRPEVDTGTGEDADESGSPNRVSLEAGAVVIATELVAEAVELANRNVAKHAYADRIEIRQGSLFEALRPDERGTFDLIVSNPPYVSDAEFEKCPPNVKDHEPATALRGGPDGLDLLRRIVAEAPVWLAPGGGLAVEIQYDQAASVRACFVEAGFTDVRLDRDTDELDRVMSGRHAGG
jgi:release factor glutamine methyltransferase